MSAETDYLQRFIDLKLALDTEERFHPRRTGLPWRIQMGVEISVVEANRCDAFYDPRGTFHASISTGQKSYIRGAGCVFIELVGGIQLGPRGVTTATFRAGLRFPDPSGFVNRWYAFAPASRNWTTDVPFQNNTRVGIASVEVSLVPFRPGAVPTGLPEQPDGRVHVLLRTSGRQIVLLENVTLDRTTQQLYGYGPRMESVDNASLWIISFFLAPGVIG